MRKNLTKKLFLSVLTLAFAVISLGASTYAWFVGMKTVNVSSFDVEIAAIDSLSLSLDAGATWGDTVTINEALLITKSNIISSELPVDHL